jgi:hypothetical protein
MEELRAQAGNECPTRGARLSGFVIAETLNRF